MKMMRAKERYKVNNVITIIRVNFMQRRTHFTFLNSFFPPSIYNRIQKMCFFFLSKWNEKERSNCSSVSLFIHLLIHSSLNIIHPSTPKLFYLYLHSSPEQKICISIYTEENMNEHHERMTKKKFTKIVLLMFRIMALSLHTHHQCRRWWNIDDDRNNDFDDDTTMAISFLLFLQHFFLSSHFKVFSCSRTFCLRTKKDLNLFNEVMDERN